MNDNQFKKRDLDALIETTVSKGRRQRNMRRLSMSVVAVIISLGTFIATVNYNDSFYAFAMDQAILKPIVQSLRFTDIYEEPEKVTFEKETYALNILNAGSYENFDVTSFEINMRDDVREFTNPKISNGNIYLVEVVPSFIGVETVALWKINIQTQELEKVIDLPRGEDDTSFNLESYEVIGNDIYITQGKEEGILVFKVTNQKFEKINSSIHLGVYNFSNRVNFFDTQHGLAYTVLEEVDGKSCYVMIVGDKRKTIACSDVGLDLLDFPMYEMVSATDKYIAYELTSTTTPDWKTNGKDSRFETAVEIYDYEGNMIHKSDDIRNVQLVEKYAIIQSGIFSEEDMSLSYAYKIVNLETSENERFDNVTDFFYGLQERNIRSYAFEFEQQLMTNVSWFYSVEPIFVTEHDLRSETTSTRQLLTIMDNGKSTILLSDLQTGILKVFEISEKQTTE